jgi:ABC-type Fe3+ transport system substrate-binding protein
MGTLTPAAVRLLALAVALLAACAPAQGPTSNPVGAPATSVEALIQKANAEGRLDGFVLSSVGPVLDEAVEAFKARYGLNITTNIVATSGLSENAAKSVTETAVGITPTFDFLVGHTEIMAQLVDAGALLSIPNWPALLPEGSASPQAISSAGFKDAAFAWTDSWQAAVFNSDLISEAAMPATMRDLGDPRYKGKLGNVDVPSDLVVSQLVYGREGTLELARAWGRNEPRVGSTNAVLQQVGLGELAFAVNVNEAQYARAAQANPKVKRHYWRDMVHHIVYFHGVRKNAPHSAAATLFVLWAAGPEAQRIWERADYTNSLYAQSRGAETKRRIEALGARIVGWADSDETLATLRWYSNTPEGQAYEQALATAMKGGQ